MAFKTRILKVNPRVIQDDRINLIIDVLRGGGVIVYPTDTFYGLGADSHQVNAVEKIYQLKGRDPSKPISLVIADISMVNDICVDIPPVFENLTRSFWPGPLTLVLRASPRLPRILQSEEGSVGVRLPDFSWLRALISRAGFPLTATSANISGQKEVSQPQKVIETFNEKVPLIVDGGETPGGLPSTVVDLTGDKPRIIREGALPSSRLKDYF